MSALSKRAREVEHELGVEWTRYHVGAQALRFLAGVVTALLLSLHNGFSDWTDLLPLLGGAVWTTAAQMFPQVPWWLLRSKFLKDAISPSTPAPAAPPADPAPPAKG